VRLLLSHPFTFQIDRLSDRHLSRDPDSGIAEGEMFDIRSNDVGTAVLLHASRTVTCLSWDKPNLENVWIAQSHGQISLQEYAENR
jgi:hypothetical protein